MRTNQELSDMEKFLENDFYERETVILENIRDSKLRLFLYENNIKILKKQNIHKLFFLLVQEKEGSKEYTISTEFCVLYAYILIFFFAFSKGFFESIFLAIAMSIFIKILTFILMKVSKFIYKKIMDGILTLFLIPVYPIYGILSGIQKIISRQTHRVDMDKISIPDEILKELYFIKKKSAEIGADFYINKFEILDKKILIATLEKSSERDFCYILSWKHRDFVEG